MGKYEARITKTSHMTSLGVAILIAFAVGLGCGYYFGQKMPINLKKHTVKPTVVQIVDPKLDRSAQVNIVGKDEQIVLIKGVLKAFYDINMNTYKRLESESLNESKSKGVSQDSIFKEKLINLYQGILAKEQLETITGFVNKGSMLEGYYLDYFNSQEGSVISSVENVEYKANTISAKTVVTNSFQYGELYDILQSEKFFGEFKGKGITTQQYAKFLKLKPSKVNITEIKDVTLTIENINGKWMITSMNDVLNSSEIRDVIIGGKNITFADLMKKYIK